MTSLGGGSKGLLLSFIAVLCEAGNAPGHKTVGVDVVVSCTTTCTSTTSTYL